MLHCLASWNRSYCQVNRWQHWYFEGVEPPRRSSDTVRYFWAVVPTWLAKDVCSCPLVFLQIRVWKIHLDRSDYQVQSQHDPVPKGETNCDHMSEMKIGDRWSKQSFWVLGEREAIEQESFSEDLFNPSRKACRIFSYILDRDEDRWQVA